MIKAPPARLLEDAGVDASLRLQLEAAASSESGYDMSAGIARFEAGVAGALAPDAITPPAGLTTPAGAAGSFALKLAAAAMGGALLIASIWYLVDRGARGPAASAREMQLPQPAAAEAPAVQVAQPVQATADPAPTPVPLAQGNKPPEPRASIGGTRSEVSRLIRARELLRSDAKAAVLLLKQIERDHPHGVLREEREGLMVLALWNTGERARAQALAQRFLANYPSSALRERLRVLVDASAEESP